MFDLVNGCYDLVGWGTTPGYFLGPVLSERVDSGRVGGISERIKFLVFRVGVMCEQVYRGFAESRELQESLSVYCPIVRVIEAGAMVWRL